ncbi:MAG: hypothetical protein HPY45_00130 [Anaerolineae bacterium]|nr:hypothetical protein [Anaerolineae bacterium]
MLPPDSMDIKDTPRKVAVKSYRNQDAAVSESGSPVARARMRRGVKVEEQARRDASEVVGKTGLLSKPPKGSSIDCWFDYYYQARQKGFNYTLKNLAKDTGYQLEYLKLLFRQYRQQHHLE